MSVNWNKVKLETNLLSLPNIYWRLRELVEQENYSLQEIADLIACDPGLTARLLRIVNSAYFGFESEIETVSRAVSVIGVNQVEELVLTTAVADTLGDIESDMFDIHQFWLGSIYRAICARHLASECHGLTPERMFIAGLLSGIGLLVLYQSVAELAEQAQGYSDETGQPLHLIERELIGFDNAAVAALLLQNWKLPDSQVMAIRHHLEPDPSAPHALETALIHIAVHMGDAIASSRTVEDAFHDIDSQARKTFGLELEQCETLPDIIAEQLSDIISLMFPNKPAGA